MEQNRMTFDDLWEQEERHGLERRLLGEYPVWKRRRRTRRAVASVAIVVVLALSPFTFHLSPSTYDYVCCNRTTFSDGHWVDVAANILISNCEI